MNAIVLMLDALGNAPQEAADAAMSQGYPFYRFIEEPRPPKVKGTLNRIKAIADSRNKSRAWIKRIHATSDYIALVDSDVVLPPNAVKMMLQAPKMIVGGWVPVRGVNDRWIASTTLPDGSFANFKEPSIRIIETTMLPLAACVIPRSIFDAIEVRAPRPPHDELVTCGVTRQKLIPSEPYLYTLDLKAKFGLNAWMHPDVICKHIENVA